MKPGDKVEVNKVWAATGGGRAPLTAWFKGYELVSVKDGKVVVRDIGDGTFNGCEYNYDLSDIRPDQEQVTMVLTDGEGIDPEDFRGPFHDLGEMMTKVNLAGIETLVNLSTLSHTLRDRTPLFAEDVTLSPVLQDGGNMKSQIEQDKHRANEAKIERAKNKFDEEWEAAELWYMRHRSECRLSTMDRKVWYLLNLDVKQRNAVVLTMWDSVVTGGGMEAWVEQGFLCTAPYLLFALEQIGTPSAERTIQMVQSAIQKHDDLSDRSDEGSEGITHLNGESMDDLAVLDTEYYTFNERLLREAALRYFGDS